MSQALPAFTGVSIPDFQFVNQYGEVIDQGTFAGKFYVTAFFFTTCPTICPVMAKHMYDIQEAFLDNDEVLLLSHSIDGKRDSVPVLRAYARKVGARPGKWHLVTGDRLAVYDIAREYYVTAAEQNNGSFLHEKKFVVVDRRGRVWGMYDGTNASSTRDLIEDLRDQL